jgi:uncharacterized protein (DUF1800 family)
MLSALLDRLSFGAGLAELDAAAKLGARAWIEEQLQPTDEDPRLRQALAQARLRIRYGGEGGAPRVDELRPLALLEQPVQALWPLTDRGNAALAREERLRPLHELTAARLLRGAYSRWQLRELLVDFWLNHFNVFAEAPEVGVGMPAFEREVIRQHALGNFAEMLEAVAASPPMLVYLNNRSSRTGAPNENYARELFELHTLGRARYLNAEHARWRDVPGAAQGAPRGYIDQDVYEAARAFTGWTIEDGRRLGGGQALPATGRFRYVESLHDPYQKRVLAQELDPFAPALADGHQVLALVAAHPGTAEHLCEKLCRRFVADVPPPSLVASAARVWTLNRRHPRQLARVLAHILGSAEFARALADPRQAKLKRPLELALSFVRKLELPFAPAAPRLFNELADAGQPLYLWPTPDGLPDASGFWLTSHGLRRRWALVLGLVENQWDTGEVGPEALMRGVDAPDAAALVAHHAARLLGEGRATAVLARLAPTGVLPDASAQPQDPQAWLAVRRALAFVAMSPEFQWR